MIPQLERVTVQLALLSVTAVSALAADAGELLEHFPPAVYFAGWVIGATLVALRFAARYGSRIRRTPAGEISRVREELRKQIAASFASRAADDRRREEQLEQLHKIVDRLNERVARIEGNLGALVVVNERNR